MKSRDLAPHEITGDFTRYNLDLRQPSIELCYTGGVVLHGSCVTRELWYGRAVPPRRGWASEGEARAGRGVTRPTGDAARTCRSRRRRRWRGRRRPSCSSARTRRSQCVHVRREQRVRAVARTVVVAKRKQLPADHAARAPDGNDDAAQEEAPAPLAHGPCISVRGAIAATRVESGDARAGRAARARAHAREARRHMTRQSTEQDKAADGCCDARAPRCIAANASTRRAPRGGDRMHDQRQRRCSAAGRPESGREKKLEDALPNASAESYRPSPKKMVVMFGNIRTQQPL